MGMLSKNKPAQRGLTEGLCAPNKPETPDLNAMAIRMNRPRKNSGTQNEQPNFTAPFKKLSRNRTSKSYEDPETFRKVSFFTARFWGFKKTFPILSLY